MNRGKTRVAFCSLATKMPLPALIRAEFEYVDPQTTQENDYYGAYNILLGHAFPATEGYVVHPQVVYSYCRSSL
jgi:hypothetical protein